MLSGKDSPNGWPVNISPNSGGGVWTRPVPGTGFGIDVLIGDVEVMLVHVLRRFHYEVATLRAGDVVGFRPAGGLLGQELNHASGTAVDIRPGSFPDGVKGGFYPAEVEVIRDILADCEAVVSWGGDFRVPRESHFQIAARPDDPRVHAVAKKIRTWNADPALGAGIVQDVTQPNRRTAARRLAAAQATDPVA